MHLYLLPQCMYHDVALLYKQLSLTPPISVPISFKVCPVTTRCTIQAIFFDLTYIRAYLFQDLRCDNPLCYPSKFLWPHLYPCLSLSRFALWQPAVLSKQFSLTSPISVPISFKVCPVTTPCAIQANFFDLTYIRAYLFQGLPCDNPLCYPSKFLWPHLYPCLSLSRFALWQPAVLSKQISLNSPISVPISFKVSAVTVHWRGCHRHNIKEKRKCKSIALLIIIDSNHRNRVGRHITPIGYLRG